ncbi:ribonuclease H-like protein [Nadsonia fulvescens var. elongata DSM 6958]|uniref:Ribonuclease H-like protein n=1 Tax=Nadsonia fulvescens var. elongata DSM 6958 TaxID=857566 RepID=A0A1E3PEF6_9ASCO|nr:ribonuclease H-like protein [Nadsonia fulvescens var. elongata DSM 6958]
MAGNIVWVDCEMTGLDHINDCIIEVCCLITDGDLNIIDEEGYESVIHQPREVMENMNEWCVEHHGKSGLTEKVLNSTKTLSTVSSELLSYIKEYVPEARTGLLAGNTIHQDRLFLVREMPEVIEYLHYRQIDVSTIKEIGKRHNPDLMKKLPGKKMAHTARADILESIAELKWYTENYFVKP